MTQDVQAPQMPSQPALTFDPVGPQSGPTAQAAQQAPQAIVSPQQQAMPPRPESFVKDATVAGQLDLGSYAARNASAIAEYAVYLIGEAGYGVSPANLRALALQLGRIARRISHRYTGNRNMQMGAYTHSLYAMKEAIRYLQRSNPPAPIPFGQSEEAWGVWAARVEGMGIAILRTLDEVYLDGSVENDLFSQLAASFPATNITAPFSGQ